MNRKNLATVAGVVVVVAVLVLVVRDPIKAANTVRQGWELLTTGVGVVFNALATFLRQLFAGAT